MDKFAHTLLALAVASCYFSYCTDAAPVVPQSHSGTSTISCDLCKVVSSVLELYLEKDSSEEKIEEAVGEICFLLKIEDKRVCDAAMLEFKVSNL